MPIRFDATLEDIMREARLTPEQLSDLNLYDFVYKHMNNGSGICPECAPWLGMRTTGDGTDGVPVPPLHPRCKCFLMPAFTAILSDILRGRFINADNEAWADHFEWLKSLPPDRLKAVVGRVRASLVDRGEVDIPDLYDGQRLKSLDDLGFDPKGNRLAAGGLKASDVLSDHDMLDAITAVHAEFHKEIPTRFKGRYPGDFVGVKRLTIYAIGIMNKSVITGPAWLLIVIELLLAFSQDDERESLQGR